MSTTSKDEQQGQDALLTTEIPLGQPAPSPAEYRPLGRRAFGRYELLIEMAKGGMATLYLARLSGPQNFEKLVAIKKIHDHLTDEGEFVDMFLDEARISALIHHPHVASIFDMGHIDSSYFIAMEYVHGQNLTDIIKSALHNPGLFRWEHACRLVSDAAAGLHAAHELKRKDGTSLGVVHRDVSPQNILVSYDGHVKVVDFGIAFAAERVSKTKAGALKGKLGYIAPEQTSGGPVERRSDIFSLGVVLYELCTLRRLFKGSTDAETIMLVRRADVPKPRTINPDLPAELERILMRALQVRPDDRFATAEQMAEELDAFLVSYKKSVTRSKVAGLMDQLFYDRRRLKDEQIQLAVEEPSTDPLRGVGMGPSTNGSLIAPEMFPKKRSRLWYGVASGAAVALVLAVGLYLALRGKTPGNGAHRAAETSTPTPRPAARPMGVTIEVDVTPAVPQTVVTFRGMRYPGSRFKVVVARSDKAERLVVSAPSYQDESVVVVPLADSRVPLSLRKSPGERPPPMERPRVRPRARPTMRRSRPRPMSGLRDFPD